MGVAQSYLDQEKIVKIRIQKDLLDYPQELTHLKFKNHWRHFEVIQKDNKKFEVIEAVPFKDYLAGVVSKEMPLSWPMEALKAQAVIARSYALVKMSERQNKNFFVDGDQMDQVFQWTDSAKAYQAVNETEDVVLAYDKKIVKAFYHSDCGGQTIPAGRVWPGANDMGTAADPWCAARAQNRWSFRVPTAAFTTKDSFSTDYFKNKIISFEDMSIQKLRQWFGFANIRNSPESFIVEGDQIVFSGRGFGHGVGLCQWGSQYMAKKGQSYTDILAHYYPKADILKIQSVLIKNYLTNNEIPKTMGKTALFSREL